MGRLPLGTKEFMQVLEGYIVSSSSFPTYQNPSFYHNSDPSDSDASLEILGRVSGKSHSYVSLQRRLIHFSLKRFGRDYTLETIGDNRTATMAGVLLDVYSEYRVAR